MNKHLLVSSSILFLLIITAPTIKAANNKAPVSPALQTVLELTEQTFIKPGTSIHQIAGSDPIMFATFVGLIMQRQKVQAYQGTDASNMERLGVLRDEALELLSWLAGELQYRDPEDGSSLPAAKLQAIFGKAYNGDYNQSFIENSGFDPATINVPYMLSQVPLPQKPGGGGDSGDGVRGKLQMTDKNEINLLGEVSPAAETDQAYHIPTQREAPPADVILGTWCRIDGWSKKELCLTFQRSGGNYVASRTRDYKRQWDVIETHIVKNPVVRQGHHPITHEPLEKERWYSWRRVYECIPDDKKQRHSECDREDEWEDIEINDSGEGRDGYRYWIGGSGALGLSGTFNKFFNKN